MIKYHLVFLSIYMIISLIWIGYELLFLGEVTPDIFDTIIASILAVSLTKNLLD